LLLAAIAVGGDPSDDEVGMRPASTRVMTPTSAPEASATTPTDHLDAALDAWAEASPARSCVAVHDAEGAVLYERNAHVSLVPASLQKLLVATAAFRVFDDRQTRERIAHMLRLSDRRTSDELVSAMGGITVVQRELEDAGISLDGVVIADGSGHALSNRMTCGLALELLEHPDTGRSLLEALAVAGQPGTLEDRFVGTPLAGNLRAKTGSLSSVTALAGQLTSRSRTAITFAYIANGDGSAIGPDDVTHQDLLATILYDQS
jgi:D-alanyl-D-alanine carboxypeptidase